MSKKKQSTTKRKDVNLVPASQKSRDKTLEKIKELENSYAEEAANEVGLLREENKRLRLKIVDLEDDVQDLELVVELLVRRRARQA